MLDRFLGDSGARLRAEALSQQRIINGDMALAVEVAAQSEVIEFGVDSVVIEQGGTDNDIYFILAGEVDVIVNGVLVQRRAVGDTVGELAATNPTQRRAATVRSNQPTILAKLTEPAFAALADKYPAVWRYLARDTARRLVERNALVRPAHQGIHVFIVSSRESLPIAHAVQEALAHDPFTCTVWTDGCFKVSQYTLEALEHQLDESDFAIAIAHADDLAQVRGEPWPAPRDNVIFELGLFMGRLGRARAILMEPRDERVKLPSDMAGITTIDYRFAADKDFAALLGPACTRLRRHITDLGPVR